MGALAWGPSEYYHEEFGLTRNPWDETRFSGGSSNGSGIAVAARMVTFALGTDTGGSIRNPASFCGVTGFKPTFGLVDRYGIMLNSPTVDTVGPIARSAADCGLVLNAIAGVPYPEAGPAVGSLADVRIGVQRQDVFVDLQPDVEHAVRAAEATLRELGAHVEDVNVPGFAADPLAAQVVLEAEASAAHRVALAECPHDYLPDIRARLVAGLDIKAFEYLAGREAIARLRANLDTVFRDIDLLLTPTRDTVAPRMDDHGRILEPYPFARAGRPQFTTPFSLSRQPAISVPWGCSATGLPVGLQLAGRRNEDRLVLHVADVYQHITDWQTRYHDDAVKPTLARQAI